MLDVILEVEAEMLDASQAGKFQSLFCWMLFWKADRSLGMPKPFYVSILILLDVILEEGLVLVFKCRCLVSILILLDVILEVCAVLH